MVRQPTSLFSLFQGDEVYVLNQRQHKPACSSSLKTLTHSKRDIFAALCPTWSAFFVFFCFLWTGRTNWPCRSPFRHESRSLTTPQTGKHHLHQQVHNRDSSSASSPVHHESLSSPSFLNASLRDSSDPSRPAKCTVIPCGRNMEAGLRLCSGDKARWAAF